MKKSIILVLTFCILINFNCFAMEKTYYLNDNKISFGFDDENFDFVYSNGNISITNPDFSFENVLQTNENDYEEMLKERNLEFDATNFCDLSEIYAQIVENDFSKSTYDLSNYTEHELEDLINEPDFKNGFNDMGLTDADVSVEKINGTTYLKLVGKTDSMFATSYFTVSDGKSISIALNSLSPDAYSKYDSMLLDLINTVDVKGNTSENLTSVIPKASVVDRIIYALIGGAILGIVATVVSKVKNNKKTDEKQKDLFED